MTSAALAPAGAVVSAGERAPIASAAADARAPSTRRAYAGQWARFEAWCRARCAGALPAAPVLVAAYLTERAEMARIATVRGADDPTGEAAVRAVVAGIARQHAARPEAAPLSLESAVLLMTLAQQPRRSGRGARPRGRRDRRARLLRGPAPLGDRRAAVAGRVGHRTGRAAAGPGARLEDQPAAGREDYRLLVGGFAAAVDGLRGACERDDDDRVVPLSGRQVNRRLKALAERAGLAGVSSHSGRRGLASELVRRGASTTAIQQAGGWRSPQMVARYASAVAVEDGAVARHFGGAMSATGRDAERPVQMSPAAARPSVISGG